MNSTCGKGCADTVLNSSGTARVCQLPAFPSPTLDCVPTPGPAWGLGAAGQAASVLLHPGPHPPSCLEKLLLENRLISLRHLEATLNIKLNPCSTSQGHGSETAHRLHTSDMPSQFLHCQQFRPVLIGTNYLQVCPWATGLLLGQLLCLPAREDGEWGAWEGLPPAVPT